MQLNVQFVNATDVDIQSSVDGRKLVSYRGDSRQLSSAGSPMRYFGAFGFRSWTAPAKFRNIRVSSRGGKLVSIWPSEGKPSTRLVYGGRYYKIYRAYLPISKAVAYCKEQGGELLSLETPEEHRALAVFMYQNRMAGTWLNLGRARKPNFKKRI